MTDFRFLRWLGVAVLLFSIPVLSGCDSDAASTGPETTDAETAPAIDFTLDELDGQPRRLSEWRGQWVVVNYWATWCAPCRKEIPDLSTLHDARDDLTVLGLAFEDTDVEVFREFLDAFPASYPILTVDVYDPPAALGAPMALPTTYLVDPQGRLVETWIGPITSTTVLDRIADEG